MEQRKPWFNFRSLVFGCAVGAVGIAAWHTLQTGNKAAALKFTGAYDRATLQRLSAPLNTTGIRFYLAKSTQNTTVAIGIQADSTHCPDNSGNLAFMLFDKLQGTATVMRTLNEQDATTAVNAATTPQRSTWSVDIKPDMITRLLAVAGAQGIALVERATTDNWWTFELVPVRFSAGQAYPVGGPGAALIAAAPCPAFCGDTRHYLHHPRP